MPLTLLAFFSLIVKNFLKEWTTVSKSLAEFPLTILLLYMEFLHVMQCNSAGGVCGIYLPTYIKHAYHSLPFPHYYMCSGM